MTYDSVSCTRVTREAIICFLPSQVPWTVSAWSNCCPCARMPRRAQRGDFAVLHDGGSAMKKRNGWLNVSYLAHLVVHLHDKMCRVSSKMSSGTDEGSTGRAKLGALVVCIAAALRQSDTKLAHQATSTHKYSRLQLNTGWPVSHAEVILRLSAQRG